MSFTSEQTPKTFNERSIQHNDAAEQKGHNDKNTYDKIMGRQKFDREDKRQLKADLSEAGDYALMNARQLNAEADKWLNVSAPESDSLLLSDDYEDVYTEASPDNFEEPGIVELVEQLDALKAKQNETLERVSKVTDEAAAELYEYADQLQNQIDGLEDAIHEDLNDYNDEERDRFYTEAEVEQISLHGIKAEARRRSQLDPDHDMEDDYGDKKYDTGIRIKKL